MPYQFNCFFCKAACRHSHYRSVFLFALTIVFALFNGVLHQAFAGQTWNVQFAELDAQNQFRLIARADINSWTGDQIQLMDSGGQRVNLSVAELLSLTSRSIPPSNSPQNGSWQLILTNGDVLCGAPVATTPAVVIFHTPDLGEVAIPLNQIAGFKRSFGTPLSGILADHDTLYFTNGDALDGAFDSIDNKNVRWESPLGATDIPLTRIDHIILGMTVPLKPVAVLQERLAFADGSHLTTTNLSYQIGQFKLDDPAGKIITFDANTLHAVAIINGNATWLSDLQPAAYQLSTYFEQQWPYRINQNVLGDSLMVNGVVFDHGIGVHTGSKITFELSGKFQRLLFAPAMDDAAGPLGHAWVSITADGKELYHSPVLQPGRRVVTVLLNITNFHTITLEAHSVDRFDVQGRVDWLNAVLLH
jgi:NPCBM/NEW2 domain